MRKAALLGLLTVAGVVGWITLKPGRSGAG